MRPYAWGALGLVILAILLLFANFYGATYTSDVIITDMDVVAGGPVLGDMVYGNDTPQWTKLAGNTTATIKYLSQTGTGAVSAEPVWVTITWTDTKCLYLEKPTPTDDLQSIWRNSTAFPLTFTKLWAESDQTVALMLQIDDGTPADIDNVDLEPAAGEDEDVVLNGDTTLDVNEELDLVITSVANTPTWVSICWTFTWTE